MGMYLKIDLGTIPGATTMDFRAVWRIVGTVG